MDSLPSVRMTANLNSLIKGQQSIEQAERASRHVFRLRVRKAVAYKRQPQRAERAMYREASGGVSSF